MFAVEVQGLYKQFGPQTVLQDVSFQLESGKIHGLVGDNGSGKSVLLKCLCGILPWERGVIRIQGRKCTPERERRRCWGWSSNIRASLVPCPDGAI